LIDKKFNHKNTEEINLSDDLIDYLLKIY
jgi:hypothetical protein